jgi:hypothetical protein
MSDLDVVRDRSRRASLLSGTDTIAPFTVPKARKPRKKPPEAAPEPSLKKQPKHARRPLNFVRKKPRPKRFRGIPPLPTFDIDKLPPSTRLTEAETAAVLRRSKSCLEGWRKQPDHPLEWDRVAGRILYRLPSVQALLKGDK